MLGNFFKIFVIRCCLFLGNHVFEQFFQDHHLGCQKFCMQLRSRCSVERDLSTNCLQRLSADDKRHDWRVALILIDLILYSAVNNFKSCRDWSPGLNQYCAKDEVSCPRTQHSACGKAQTHNLLISSQALYQDFS